MVCHKCDHLAKTTQVGIGEDIRHKESATRMLEILEIFVCRQNKLYT